MFIETDETPILAGRTYSFSEWVMKSKNGQRLNLGEVARYNHNMKAVTQAILSQRMKDREDKLRRMDVDACQERHNKLRRNNFTVVLPKRFRKGVK